MTKELLEKYPKVTNVVKEWFRQKWISSLQEDNPFYDSFLKREISNEELLGIFDDNARALFDVFDENGIYITISVSCGGLDKDNKAVYLFRFSFNDSHMESNDYLYRKDCESKAVEKAFELLENKL